MRKAAILSVVIIGAFCLMGFGPGEVTRNDHPADSYSTHQGSSGPWAKNTARDSVLAGKRLPTGGGGMDFSNMGAKASNGLRKLGPAEVGNWGMDPAEEVERSCRYGSCNTDVVKPVGSPSGGMGAKSGRDKYFKKGKIEQFGLGNNTDIRSNPDDYASRPRAEKDDDASSKDGDKNKKGKSSGLSSLSAMEKLSRHRVSGDVHPADSYNTTVREINQPMKVIDPARMPYRIYKMFLKETRLEGVSSSNTKKKSAFISTSDEEKTLLDGLRKKTWSSAK